MGLTLQPNFSISADGNDITTAIRKRLVSLHWRDEAGIEADSLELRLDDAPNVRGGYIEMPRKGVALNLALGYGDQLASIGKFIVDEANPGGFPELLTIRAKSADMRDRLKVKKSRGFDHISIAQLVATIATEHKLTPKVAASLGHEVIARVDQPNESDMHLLTRLARERGAVAKPAYGFLLFTPKGEAKAASGRLLPKVTLDKTDLLDWDCTLADREQYNSVIALWYDKATAKEHQLHAGAGAPAFNISRRYADAASAQKAADARFNVLRAGTALMRIRTAGRADLVAESAVTLTGMRPGIPTTWTIESASHSLDKTNGWQASLNMVLGHIM